MAFGKYFMLSRNGSLKCRPDSSVVEMILETRTVQPYSFSPTVNMELNRQIDATSTTARMTIKMCIRDRIMGTIVMALASVGLYVFADPLIGVFTPDQEVIAIAAECLRIMAVIQIPQMIAWV